MRAVFATACRALPLPPRIGPHAIFGDGAGRFCCSGWKTSAVGSVMAAQPNQGASCGGDAADGGISEFRLSSSSVLKIQKGDITTWSVRDKTAAIVNAANERMLGGGGVDGAIHRAAGPQLRAACEKVPEVQLGVRCPPGEARITGAFSLPVSYVIHTVGPIYIQWTQPGEILRSAYRNCLELAKENNIQCIAFPAISCGVFGYPFEEAAKVAISTIKDFCLDLEEVHFVLFSDDIYDVWLKEAKKLII